MPALAMAATACGCDRCGDASATDAAPVGAASAEALAPTEPVASLPPSDRVFAPTAADGACQRIVGGDGRAAWLAIVGASGAPEVRWRRDGEGELQLAAAGDFGRGDRLYLARGRGKSAPAAALVLDEVDLESGAASELFRNAGERNDAAHLSIDDVDGDGAAELAFAYFADRYHVRPRHLEADGEVVEGEAMRMATSRAYADFDGDGRVDEAIGRIYGDAVELPGDLRVRVGSRWLAVPTDRGVRALVAVERPPARATLWFSDGWARDYGREARAQLKRAVFVGDGFQVEPVGSSADEYTFFELWVLRGADDRERIVARGNAWITSFEPDATAGWTSRRSTRTGEVQATAACRMPNGTNVVWVPGRDATRAWPLGFR